MEPPSPKEVDLDASSLAQLASSDARALLDTIDGLRQLGVGDIVDLPQIIVVGDQSAGKSSVLEALSRVRFPVDGDLCTRFATELILRRAEETALQVTIQYADEASSMTQRGGAPPQPFQRQSFDKDALPDIIKEAQELMGISKGGAKKFSKDILRVEIAGPDIYPLTLVDLPGIFHSATADQDLKGKEIVDQLIESYMKQPKSIILAVVAANNQLANQLVLQQARKFDPLKERTIGVITKPDLAGPGSSNERKYLDLARGRESMHKLALGWYVLRNRSEEERASGDASEHRDAKEERFFRTSAWNSVSPLNRGVECLRKKLSKVLLDHIKASLPDLIQEIEVKLSACQEKLARLGKSRSSPEELRSYLHGIAGDFQRLARDAVDGRYNDRFFGGIGEEKNALKLRAVLRNLSRAFYAVMKTKGARYKIVWEEDMADDGEDDDEMSSEIWDLLADYLQPYIDVYKVPDLEVITEGDLNARLLSYAAGNQGRELPGMPSAELVLQLFKENAERWPGIARTHVEQVLEKTEDFAVKAFDHIIGADQSTADAIWRGCLEPFFHEKKEALQSKLQELLLPYMNGRSLPPEREFLAAVSKKTLQRLANRVADRLEEDHPQWFQTDHKGRLSRSQIRRAILDNWDESESSEFGTEKVLDMMVAYYEVSHFRAMRHANVEKNITLTLATRSRQERSWTTSSTLPWRAVSSQMLRTF
jgi:GTPase SAR1 family protein